MLFPIFVCSTTFENKNKKFRNPKPPRFKQNKTTSRRVVKQW